MEMNKHFEGSHIWSFLRHSVIVGDPTAVCLHCSGEATILFCYMTIKGLFSITVLLKTSYKRYNLV